MLTKLTREEVERLLKMLKKSVAGSIDFPEKGTATEFELIGDTKMDLFITKIYRGKIDAQKYEIGARIKKDGILLLELHVNPSKVHLNPDGKKIIGSHWHIYTVEYGRQMAYPAEDIEADKFVENTMNFLDKFNVIEKPVINHQMEIVY